jgi:hypothetical protein
MQLLAVLYFCTLVSLGFWAFSAVDDPPEYEELYPVSGELREKREAGGGKTGYYYAVYLNIDGEPQRFTMEHDLTRAYRSLKKGDRVELKVEGEGEHVIHELKANGRLLASYHEVVEERYTNQYVYIKWLSIVLSTLSALTLIPLVFLFLRLSDDEVAALEARLEKRRKERARNKKYESKI